MTKDYHLGFTNRNIHKLALYIKAGLRIGMNAFVSEKPLHGDEVAIIKKIHTIRYAETNPYVITGGHFYQIFVRNMGIFFNALVDPRIPSSEEDWYLRQSIALKTIAHDLELFKQAGREFTTLTPVTKNLYTGLDIYARPSDSLHAIVYTFRALLDASFIESIWSGKAKINHTLQTQTVATKLLKDYKKTLQNLISTYNKELLDPATGLIKQNLLLSSARDGIKRQSSFYDNVILWATNVLADELRIMKFPEKEVMKKRIIKAFWDEKAGIFIDDLSEESKTHKLFSADIFITTSTRFLSTKVPKERKMLLGMVNYVKAKKLDHPFPLRYSLKDKPEKLYRPVRFAAPSYMGETIWSHWGMEYIKTLLLLSPYKKELRKDAENHLTSYAKNIKQFGGYPELYDKKGKPYKTPFYRGILHNGWVINYEQARILLTA